MIDAKFPLEAFEALRAADNERAKLEARLQGHSVVEQPLQDGSVKLTVTVGGVA